MNRLKEARERLRLTQEQVAARLNVSPVTVSRWESGAVRPHGYQLRGIRELYDASAEEILAESETSRASATTLPPPQGIAFAQFGQDSIASLAALPFSSTSTSLCFDDYTVIVRALSEKAMNLSSRRAFLKGTLASLIFLPISNVSSSSQYDLLHRCTVGLAAAHKMSRSTDAHDLHLAFDATSIYDGILKSIADHSTALRTQALELLAQCGILRTILGWHCVGDNATLSIAKDALSISKQVYEILRDPSLPLSAYSKFAWAHSYNSENEDALQVALEAKHFLLQQDSAKVPAGIRGGTFSTLALMMAKNGESPDEALGEATKDDPGDNVVALMEFTRDDIALESGLTHYEAGNQQKAMHAFEEIIDANTLALKPAHFMRSERGRLSTVHAMAESCLATPGRSKEQITKYFLAITDGAHSLQSKWLLNKARGLHRDMKMAFPGEKDVLELRERLVAHW